MVQIVWEKLITFWSEFSYAHNSRASHMNYEMYGIIDPHYL